MHRYGGPEVLVYEDVPRPRPEQGEVLVRVEAASVNSVDWKIREGYLKEILDHSLPLIIGWDVSGVVAETGLGVTRFKTGDEVFSRPVSPGTSTRCSIR
jgi:NADPH:quinone reductase-like Zn-dependent oxidoreductase